MAKQDHNILSQKDWPKDWPEQLGKIWRGKKIGLLGGSFNPAHDAHLEISRAALTRLNLDAIWWLVSPQNPLKSESHMAGFEDRMASANAAAADPRIYVTDLEKHLNSRYTVDTVDKITALLPSTAFVWLMGADNLAQFSQWKDWQKIARTVVFAIFDRPSYSTARELSDAALFFKENYIPEENAADLIAKPPPAWTFIRDIQNPLSSTQIRETTLKPKG